MARKSKARAPTRRRVWLSVDWDFFQEERVDWDWSHAERGNIYSHIVWPGRAFYCGDDIRPITSPERHEPKASVFWELFRDVHVSANEIGIADSHAAALPFFYQLGKADGFADELWNYDAHHDLGYAPLEKLRAWAKEGKAEAGSWAYVLMKQRECRKLHYTMVYPSWKDSGVEPRPWEQDEDIDVRVSQLRSALAPDLDNITITGVFIAKSESWSPPWNDEAFTAFVGAAITLFDLPLTQYGPTNVLPPREWDNAAVEAYQAQVAEFRNKQRRGSP